MTEFRKELNKLLKEPEIAKIVDRYNSGYMLFDEAVSLIAERNALEQQAVRKAKNNPFTMADQTEDELIKGIKKASTDHLRKFVG